MIVSARKGAPGVQQEEQAMNSMARRMFELVEPIGVIPYSADEPNEAMFALGFTSYWDTYFAGRAAPLGLAAAEVVDALFYNFAPGEVARHIPKVWRTTTPEPESTDDLGGRQASAQVGPLLSLPSGCTL